MSRSSSSNCNLSIISQANSLVIRPRRQTLVRARLDEMLRRTQCSQTNSRRVVDKSPAGDFIRATVPSKVPLDSTNVGLPVAVLRPIGLARRLVAAGLAFGGLRHVSPFLTIRRRKAFVPSLTKPFLWGLECSILQNPFNGHLNFTETVYFFWAYNRHGALPQ